MTRATLDPDLENEFAAIAQGCGCELVDARFHAGLLKIVLDHPEGVALTHCQTVSKQVSALLDVSDWGAGRYTLEVSSPGLDRELRRPRDFERFTGSQMKVTWRSDEGKRTDVGTLETFIPADADNSGGAEIEMRIDPERCQRIPLQSIDVARLVPEL